MNYFVKRGDQQFGPYSLADVQRYVQAGNIGMEDLAQSEGMSEWIPVSQVLGNIPAAVTSYGAAAAPAMEPVELVPLAPNLHWAVLLLLEVVTRQLFNLIWALVQANWARKLIKDNKPMVLVAMYPAGMLTGIFAVGFGEGLGSDMASVIGGLCIFGGLIAYIIGIFSIRSAMEEYYNSTENIGLSLSGVMTFFFSTIYLQYHINRIARWKKTGQLN
ncbi:MAG TPA: DUF4339 domain-containing protein [Candidatus Angelobacter sp.]